MTKTIEEIILLIGIAIIGVFLYFLLTKSAPTFLKIMERFFKLVIVPIFTIISVSILTLFYFKSWIVAFAISLFIVWQIHFDFIDFNIKRIFKSHDALFGFLSYGFTSVFLAMIIIIVAREVAKYE